MSVQAAVDYAASLLKRGMAFPLAAGCAAARYAIDFDEVQAGLTARSVAVRTGRSRRRRPLLTPKSRVTRTATTAVPPAPAQVYYGPPD